MNGHAADLSPWWQSLLHSSKSSFCCNLNSERHTFSPDLFSICLLSNRLKHKAAAAPLSLPLINKPCNHTLSLYYWYQQQLHSPDKSKQILSAGSHRLETVCLYLNLLSIYSSFPSFPPFCCFPFSVSYLQRFPEPGARHHGPAGAPSQDDPEGKNTNDRGQPGPPRYNLTNKWLQIRKNLPSAATTGRNPFILCQNQDGHIFIRYDYAELPVRELIFICAKAPLLSWFLRRLVGTFYLPKHHRHQTAVNTPAEIAVWIPWVPSWTYVLVRLQFHMQNYHYLLSL